MIFNSGFFMVIFTLFLLVYTLIYQRGKFMTSLWVVTFSLFFYYKSSGIFFLLILLTSVSDFLIAQQIKKAKTKRAKRSWLFLALLFSFGILGYFKYTNFILFNISKIIESNFAFLEIILPVGISFYTFQSVSYVLDIYWEKMKPTKNFLDYAFFLTFFPQLVAGPIVKASHFLPQLEKIPVITKQAVYTGLWLIIVGLFKKAVIADYVAQYNDIIFSNPSSYNGFENLMAVYGYTIQIYCDFSGYSDMAIGLGLIMGYNLGTNFNFPYKARNITDFWRRWHISLSSWLRDYIYIPLGGNRKGKIRTYINLFLTMLIGGLWHGAAWRFVFWGGMHGLGLAIHKFCKKWLQKIPDNFPSKSVSWFITFHFVIFLWIFFRANDITIEVTKEVISNGVATEIISKANVDGFSVAWIMIEKIFSDTDFSYFAVFLQARWLWLFLVIIGFAMHGISTRKNEQIANAFVKMPFVLKLLIFLFVVQLVLQLRLE
ncbi:MAG: hypothetical protein A2309_08775, partial [Bacteroidetes bacterium RIFOXYB2_FULL_35_7]